MKNNDEEYNRAIKYIVRKGVTAYELHVFSGHSQSGLIKILNGTVDKPRRKTKELIINFYNKLKEEDNNFEEEKENNNFEEEELINLNDNDTIKINDLVDIILVNFDKLKKNKKISILLKNEKNEAIIEYQEKLLDKYENQ